jgi:hypothetical protein
MLGLQLLKARPQTQAAPSASARPDKSKAADPAKDGTHSVDTAVVASAHSSAKDEGEKARRKRARETMRASQNLLPPAEEQGPVVDGTPPPKTKADAQKSAAAASPSRLQKSALNQDVLNQAAKAKPMNSKKRRQQQFIKKKLAAKAAARATRAK